MPLTQGGPPRWVWERTADFLKSGVVPVPSPEGHTVYELRPEILRPQFFTRGEIRELAAQLAARE
jgi:hypothetical protein